MICWVKLIRGMLVWKKRTVIASPSFNSPTCNSRMDCLRSDPLPREMLAVLTWCSWSSCDFLRQQR
jgi:hypothetical protein